MILVVKVFSTIWHLPYGYDHKYVYSHLGYNLKITDMQAACGLAQLDSLRKILCKTKEKEKF